MTKEPEFLGWLVCGKEWLNSYPVMSSANNTLRIIGYMYPSTDLTITNIKEIICINCRFDLFPLLSPPDAL